MANDIETVFPDVSSSGTKPGPSPPWRRAPKYYKMTLPYPQGARLIDEFGEMVASHVWGHVSSNADEARRLLEECYQGAWESLEAYAEDLLESSLYLELGTTFSSMCYHLKEGACSRQMEWSGKGS